MKRRRKRPQVPRKRSRLPKKIKTSSKRLTMMMAASHSLKITELNTKRMPIKVNGISKSKIKSSNNKSNKPKSKTRLASQLSILVK